MGFHTFDPERAENLEDESRYRWCSIEELISLLAPERDDEMADLGSGTGFYTDPIAERVRLVHAVDVQPEMHALYEENGVPENVKQVTAEVSDMPFEDGSLDGVFSTMTYHEFSGIDAMEEIERVLAPGGRVVFVDWDRHGDGEGGSMPGERHDLGHAVTALGDVGLTVDHAVSRTETFVCRARKL